jgi:hypothetical protein
MRDYVGLALAGRGESRYKEFFQLRFVKQNGNPLRISAVRPRTRVRPGNFWVLVDVVRLDRRRKHLPEERLERRQLGCVVGRRLLGNFWVSTPARDPCATGRAALYR